MKHFWAHSRTLAENDYFARNLLPSQMKKWTYDCTMTSQWQFNYVAVSASITRRPACPNNIQIHSLHRWHGPNTKWTLNLSCDIKMISLTCDKRNGCVQWSTATIPRELSCVARLLKSDCVVWSARLNVPFAQWHLRTRTKLGYYSNVCIKYRALA